MAEAVVMPKVGETAEDASIVRWLKREGDAVRKGDVLFEIETDKAVLEVESYHDGTLLKVLVQEDVQIPVNSTVAFVGEAGEAVPDIQAENALAAPAGPAASTTPAREATPTEDRKQAPAPVVLAMPATPTIPAAAPPSIAPATRLIASPRARAMAREKAIDIARVNGTGPNGRVVARDVDAYLELKEYDKIRVSPAAKRMAIKEKLDILAARGSGTGGRIMVDDIKRALEERPRAMSRMRQVIARRLTESFTTTPHFYVSVSVDMTDLLAFRQTLKRDGHAYSVTDFILEAAVLSLQEFPVMNSVTDGQTVRWYGSVDLGMAVGLEEGLVVPVIRDAGNLSMVEIHDLASGLAERAREGRLMPDEMSGSTFTVTNMGMMDVEAFTAIINPGESGILAVSSTIDKPVVIEKEIRIRSMMSMTLSADHRVVDGTVGATFINAAKSKLEDIRLWRSLT